MLIHVKCTEQSLAHCEQSVNANCCSQPHLISIMPLTSESQFGATRK